MWTVALCGGACGSASSHGVIYWIDDAGHAQSSCSAGPGFIDLTPGVINVIDALLTHDIRHVNTCFSSLSLTAVAVTAEDIPSYNRVGRA